MVLFLSDCSPETMEKGCMQPTLVVQYTLQCTARTTDDQFEQDPPAQNANRDHAYCA
jgi:hypothetical protein